MKQRITIDQLNELSDEQKGSLREWWNPSTGDLMLRGTPFLSSCEYLVNAFDRDHVKSNFLPVLSIGQMTHFLYEETNDWGIHYNDSGVFFTVYLSWNMETARMSGRLYSSDELADALWDAVKSVL